MDEDMKEKIINALIKYVNTDEGKKSMYDIYDIVGLIPTKDSDYDRLRKMLKEQGV